MKRFYFAIMILLFSMMSTAAQTSAPNQSANAGGMALALARFELEMKPGTETTVVVNLDFHSIGNSTQPARIVATLNDWDITPNGQVGFYPAATRANSASSWLIYSPGEAAVMPGTVHQIRVTVSVPLDATPGDHLAALIIEQRPEQLKVAQNTRQIIVKYRMASVFYIKVAGLTRKGSFENLLAESSPNGIVVTPTLKNDGNSMIRPTASVKVLDADGKVVADIPDIEPLPVLAGTVANRSVEIDKTLAPGNYTVKYRIDFQDGHAATEGVTDLVVKPIVPRIASSGTPPKKP